MAQPTMEAEQTLIDAVDIRRQLDRILDFPELQASDRRRSMLKFVVEEALSGRAAGIKATTIAMAVFDRGTDFDQQSDPVVRLEARKLRRDLDNYYAGPGREDPVRIDIPKGGYVPAFSTQSVADRADEPAAENGASASDGKRREVSRENRLASRLAAIIGAGFRPAMILTAIAACLAALTVWSGRQEEGVAGDPASPGRAASILVEGFDTREAGDLVSLVASGLEHEIVADLLRFRDLRVHLAPRERTDGIDPVTSGVAPLETDFTVAGTVWREGEEVNVRAELIRRADREVLWSERYAEGIESRSIGDIQRRISGAIATVVGQQHGHTMRAFRASHLVERNDPSLRGFACVALAQIYRRTYRESEYQAARDCLEATVREDPDYVRAWAMLAYLRNDAARFGYFEEPSVEQAFLHAREAATRAIDLDPNDTDALQAMSHVEQYSGDIERSIHFARRAVEVNPNDPAPLANLAIRLTIAGQFSEAASMMQRAIDRSVAPPPFYFYAIAADHMMREEWRAMLAAAERASADDWSLSQALLAIAHDRLSNEQAAREALELMEERDPRLAEEPRAWLEGHNFDPALINAISSGLAQARQRIDD